MRCFRNQKVAGAADIWSTRPTVRPDPIQRVYVREISAEVARIAEMAEHAE